MWGVSGHQRICHQPINKNKPGGVCGNLICRLAGLYVCCASEHRLAAAVVAAAAACVVCKGSGGVGGAERAPAGRVGVTTHNANDVEVLHCAGVGV